MFLHKHTYLQHFTIIMYCSPCLKSSPFNLSWWNPRKHASMETKTLLLLSLTLLSLVSFSTSFTPTNNYHINCGSNTNTSFTSTNNYLINCGSNTNTSFIPTDSRIFGADSTSQGSIFPSKGQSISPKKRLNAACARMALWILLNQTEGRGTELLAVFCYKKKVSMRGEHGVKNRCELLFTNWGPTSVLSESHVK